MPAMTCWSSSSGLSRVRRPASSGLQHDRVEAVGQRVDAEVGQLRQLDVDVVGIEHDDLAERPRVDEPQLLGRRARQAPARRGCGRALGTRPGASSSWPLIRRCTIIVSPVSSGQQQVLAAPVGREDRGAGQAVDDLLLGRPPHACARVRPRRARSVRPTTRPAKPAPDGLDLGELRHGRRRAGRRRRPPRPARPPSSTAPCPARSRRRRRRRWRRTAWRGRGPRPA